MKKFSIVVPCYNSFDKMKKCLECLESQTFKDFETIFVDDCSTDTSYIKLEEYLKESKLDFKLLQNEKNLGPGPTRNKGIENATGEYITFLDVDDYIENTTFEELEKILEKDKKIDCIVFDFYQITKHNRVKRKSFYKTDSQYLTKEDSLIYVNTTTSCKVYLLENIKNNNVVFPDLMRNEDFVFNKLALAASNHIYYYENNLYYYIDNPISLMHNEKLCTEKNNIIGFEIVEKKLKDTYDEELKAIFIKEYLYAMTLNLIGRGASSKEVKEHINYCHRKYPDIYKNVTIKNMNIFQRLCIKATRIKSVILLKILLKIKIIIKALI